MFALSTREARASSVVSSSGRVRRLAVKGGVSLLAVACASAAQAQCAPDPMVSFTTTVCSGNDPNGILINVPNGAVTVNKGATVNGVTSSPLLTPGAFPTTFTSLVVDGSVTGGILADNGNTSGFFGTPGNRFNITVNEGGSVTGPTAIRLATSASTPMGSVGVNVNNSGLIQSANGGPAITTADIGRAYIESLANQATGSMGAIDAPIGQLTNRGTISGGTLGAVRHVSDGSFIGALTVANSGTITSASASPTYEFSGPGNPRVTNDGVIANTGTGVALRFGGAGQGTPTVRNNKDGSITAANGVAIEHANRAINLVNEGTISGVGTAISGGDVSLTNTGTINGNIVTTGFSAGSTVRLYGGVVNGSVTLGNGQNLVEAEFDPITGTTTSVTGTITVGTGTNTFRAVLARDYSIASEFAAPAGFQNVQISLDRSTLTLDKGFALQRTLIIESDFAATTRGPGTVVNLADFSAPGPIIRSDDPQITFDNRGSVETQVVFDPAINLSGPGSKVLNSGTIAAIRPLTLPAGFPAPVTAVRLTNGEFVNSGTITSQFAAVEFTGTRFENSGTLSGVVNVALSNFSASVGVNSGLIDGALTLRGALRNTGTISRDSLALRLGQSATIINETGGVIDNITSDFDGTNVRVINSGLVGGSINLTGSQFFFSSNRVILLPGSEVRGDIRLGGGGDELVIPIASLTSSGGVTGVTGTISGSFSQTPALRLLVDGTVSTAVPQLSAFGSVIYQMAAGSDLTLSGPLPSRGLDFAGQGKLDLNINGAASDVLSFADASRMIDLTAGAISLETGNTPLDAKTEIAAISRGNLTQTLVSENFVPVTVVALQGGSSFENAGTITVEDRRAPSPFSIQRLAGIQSSGEVVNSGTLRVGGANAVAIESNAFSSFPSVERVTNTGSILAVDGLTGGVGIAGSSNIVNSGTIRTSGSAIRIGFLASRGDAVVNSGAIESTGAPAIGAESSFTPDDLRIINLAGGTIRAPERAVSLGGGGIVDNAGAISGDVVFGGSMFAFGTGTYIARGGTLDGDLVFNSSGRVIAFGDQPVATGEIVAKGASDVFARILSQTTTVDASGLFLSSFEQSAIGAAGPDTTVTITGSQPNSNGLTFFGNGRVVNQADLSRPEGGNPGFVTLGDLQLNAFAGVEGLIDFVNEGKLQSVGGTARSFTNAGTISNSEQFSGTVSLGVSSEGRFEFANSGRIERINAESFPARAVTISSNLSPDANATLGFKNSGEIIGGVSVASSGQQLSFSNSGSITGIRSEFASVSSVNLFLSASDFDAPQTVDIANSGQLTDGMTLNARATNIVVNNSGDISRLTEGANQPRGRGALDLFNTALAEETAVVTNSGTIRTDERGNVALSAFLGNGNQADENGVFPRVTADLKIENSGLISATGGAELRDEMFLGEYLAATVGLQTRTGNSTEGRVTVVNAATGRIEASGKFAESPDVSLPDDFGVVAVFSSTNDFSLDNAGVIAGGTGSDLTKLSDTTNLFVPNFFVERDLTYLAGAIQTIRSVDRVVNRAGGEIIGSIDLNAMDDVLENYGIIRGDVFLGDGDDRFVIGALSQLVGTVDAGAGLNSLVIDSTGGTGQRIALDNYLNFGPIAFTGTGNVGLAGTLKISSIAIGGTSLTVAAGDTLETAGPTTVIGSDAAETIVNNGTIVGGVALGGGDDSVTNAGTIGGALTLGDGADTVVNLTSGVLGAVDLAGGNNVVDNAGTIGALTYLGGDDRLTNSGTVASLALGDGANVVANTGKVTGAVAFGTGADQLNNGGTLGNIVFADGANSFTNSGTAGDVAFGTGADTLANNVGGKLGAVDFGAGANVATNAGTAGALTFLAGDDRLTNSGTVGNVAFGDGANSFGNAGTAGALTFGAGNDSLTNAAAGSLTSVDLGGGANSVTNQGAIAGPLSFGGGDDKLTNALGGKLSAISFGDGANSLTNQGQIAGPLSFGAGVDTVVNGGTITGAVTLGDGNDSFANSGDLSGATLDFGAGADVFTAQKGGRFGPVSGGAGEDTLVLQLGGTDAQPERLASVPSGFEILRNETGTVLFAEPASFNRVEIIGGRLIGGARLTAPTIIVNQGATFGSAGQVIGNIQVAGTLAPGASPGVMQVTGNVALAGTSTTVFELTPTVSDQLLISGTLSIAQGATLRITPESTIRPGGQLDLIVANGGITGAFSTISTGGALGFIRALPDRIQLLGQFANAGFNRQTTNAIDYVNRVLVSGRAPSGLLTALPSLLGANGATNGAAFARLTAESYASAGQIGTEQGLALATAARNMPLTSSDTAGLFGFASGILNERFLSGSARFGTSQANVRSRGLFGGVGYGTAELAVGAFVGTVGSDQDLVGLGASNDTDGLVAGITGQYAGGPLGIRFTFAYDDSDATTQRAVPGGSLRGVFGLRSWIGDGSISYALPISSEFQLVPEAGLTWVSTRRGRVAEAGSPFALSVSRLTRETAFADGSIALRTTPEAGAIQSWLKAGVRQQLTGDRTFAVAGFRDVDLGFLSRGVTRSRTLGVLGAGLSADLGRNLRVFASYQGEFGNSGEGHNASLGVRLGF